MKPKALCVSEMMCDECMIADRSSSQIQEMPMVREQHDLAALGEARQGP